MDIGRTRVRSRLPIIVLDYFTALMVIIQTLNVFYHFWMSILSQLIGGSFYFPHGILESIVIFISTIVFILILVFVYLPQRATFALSDKKTFFWMLIIVAFVTSSFMVVILMISLGKLVLFWHVSGLTFVGIILSTVLTWLLRVKRTFVKKPLSVIIGAHFGLILRLIRR